MSLFHREPSRIDPDAFSAPTLERLEDRMLLSAGDFLTPIGYWADGRTIIGVSDYSANLEVFGDSEMVWTFYGDQSYAVLHFKDADGTPIGDLMVELFDALTPNTVERFKILSQNYVAADGTLDPDGIAYYTDVLVHRVIDDFMFQTGDAQNGNGTGGSPLGAFNDEIVSSLNFSTGGMLAMANSGANTQDSQFFITEKAATWLNGKYTIFGKMIYGSWTYDSIMSVDVESNGSGEISKPISNIYLSSIDIYEGILLVNNDSGGTETITVVVDDDQGGTTEQTINITCLGQRPAINPVPDRVVAAGSTVNYILSATDDGGMGVSWGTAFASDTTAIVTFNTNTGILNVQLPNSYYGLLSITVTTVEAGVLGVTPRGQSFYIWVNPVENTAEDPVPTLDSRLDAAGGYAMATAVWGDWMFVAAGASGVQAFNISGEPGLVGTIDTNGAARDIEVVQQNVGGEMKWIAYVADSQGGLVSIDVTDPGNMQILDVFAANAENGSIFWNLAVEGNVVFVAQSSGGLGAYDVSDPSNIREISTLKTLKSYKTEFDKVIDVVVYNGYAYVTDYSIGTSKGIMLVVNVRNPAKMREGAAYNVGGNPWGMTLSNGRLYVASSSSSSLTWAGITVWDLSTPSRPKLDSYYYFTNATNISVVNQVAVVTAHGTVTFLDLSGVGGIRTMYTMKKPTVTYQDSIGVPSFLNGKIYVPLGSAGVVALNAQELAARTMILGKAKIMDGNGNPVYIDTGGALVTLFTSGFGSGNIEKMIIEPDASGKNAVKITSKAVTTIGEVIIDGSLGGFDARMADLAGNFTISGSLGKLVLRDVGNVTLDIGADSLNATLSIAFNRVEDLILISDTPIKSLIACDWLDTDATADTITAPWIGQLTTQGDRKNGISGDFEADLYLSGVGAPKEIALAAVKIAGSLIGVNWDIVGNLGQVTVCGWVDSVRVTTAASMAGWVAGAMKDSDFLAGCAVAADQRHATADTDFSNPNATIQSVIINGLKGSDDRFFLNSNFSAASMGSVKLVNAELNNGGEEFGFFLLNAGTGREIKSVANRETINRGAVFGNTATGWNWSPKEGAFNRPDMVVRLI